MTYSQPFKNTCKNEIFFRFRFGFRYYFVQFKEKDYEECFDDMIHGMFFLNWSINEWEEARRGDMFYMMRVGDDKAGIMFSGQFLTDPYPDDDWDGSTKRRMYVDMVCIDPVEPGERPHISLEKLMTTIPDFDWQKGHSGVLLPEDVTEKLDELCREDYMNICS